MTSDPTDIVGRAEFAMQAWATQVAFFRGDLAKAEATLGDAVERAHRARKALARAEAQFENAQALLRKAEELTR